MSVRICIIGAGAIGGLTAAFMAKAGFDVTLVTKHPEIAAIKDRLLDLGASYAAMTGSGSAVYGLFNTPLLHIEEKFSDCFVRQREL